MRGNLVASAILHGVVLVWAMVSIGAPASFEVADVEALPVDIIPVESITQTQQGDEKATMKEKAAPIPTNKPTKVENAENVGDNEIDLKTPPTPEKRPQNVETAAAPEKVEKVLPKQDDVANEIKEIQKEVQETTAATEVAAKAEPKQEVTPDPKPEVDPKPDPKPVVDAKPESKPTETKPETEAATAETAEEALPENVPVPVKKPKVEPKKTEDVKPETKPDETKTASTETAKSQTAKTPDRTDDKKKKQETAKSKSSKNSDFNANDISALLNKVDAKAGGAKGSTEEASLGTKKTTGGSKLSQSEMDALRGQIENNWSVIAGIEGAEGVQVKVTMRLDESGDIIGEPEVTASGGSDTARRTLEGSALRAVMKSRPFKNLPRDKYDAWSEVVVNFDPSELL